ncbi:MAG TPA: MFS transporter [Xanthobacteraceae bacterium]|nr:MFS transporter [Xanthobacteraceae bacterium]
MADIVNAGRRLDRLPIGAFHRRILLLIGAGMFFDSFDIYLAGGVLGALIAEKWSDVQQNATFISATFVGMTIGAAAAGIIGDRLGRRFAYQANLLIFGLASLAAAAAPSMLWLIVARFVAGIGLGAEIVLGYASLIEFIPPAVRGRWAAYLSLLTNSALFVSTAIGYLVIPNVGWRWMFVIAGLGALVVWYLRKAMPESPRWLEAVGRTAEAEALLGEIERALHVTTPAPAAPPHATTQPGLAVLFQPDVIGRVLLGVFLSIVLGTAIYGFVAWIPTFFVQQGIGVTRSLFFTTLMSFGGPVGALVGVLISDRVGRKWGIAGASALASVIGAIYVWVGEPSLITALGFVLVSLIYLLVTLIVATYIPELFPTEYRMVGTGFVNMVSRIWTIAVPQMVVLILAVFSTFGVVATISGLLLLQALVVAAFGIETRKKPLEELAG